MRKKIPEKLYEIIVYVFYGVLATVISWGSYAVFERVFDFGEKTVFNTTLNMDIIVSNTLSWTLAMVFAFFTNKLRVFKSKSFEPKLVTREFFSFAASRGVTGAIELIGVPLLANAGFDKPFFNLVHTLSLEKIGVLLTPGIYSKVSVSVIIVVLNYVFSKLIVFRKAASKADGEEPETAGELTGDADEEQNESAD